MNTIADALWLARLRGSTVAVPEGLSLAQAYAVAEHNHARRLAEGAHAVGRKIGHTWPASWAAQGIAAPSWGWLYARSTAEMAPTLDLSAWREPKAEVELVLRLGLDRQPRAMALGIEIVDRPYPSWDFPVAASIAAGGVHAALLLGPWQVFDNAVHGPLLSRLSAQLQVGDARSEGGSARVLGSPLAALEALSALLHAQDAPPLQPDEIVTTGALAPSLPLRAGERCEAMIEGLPLAPLRWVCN